MEFTVQDILMIILIIAGILVLAVLAKLILSITKITSSIGDTLDENKASLEATIRDIPKITNNVNHLLDNTQGLIANLEPQIVATLSDVNTVTSQVAHITTNVSDTVEVVGIAAADTVSRFTNSVHKSTNKYSVFKGILNSFIRR